MKILLSSGSLEKESLDILFGLADKNNLHGIEWIMRSSGRQPDCQLFKKLADRHNIRIANVHAAFYTPVLFRSFSPLKNIAGLVNESADFAVSVGADKLVVHPF